MLSSALRRWWCSTSSVLLPFCGRRVDGGSLAPVVVRFPLVCFFFFTPRCLRVGLLGPVQLRRRRPTREPGGPSDLTCWVNDGSNYELLNVAFYQDTCRAGKRRERVTD